MQLHFCYTKLGACPLWLWPCWLWTEKLLYPPLKLFPLMVTVTSSGFVLWLFVTVNIIYSSSRPPESVSLMDLQLTIFLSFILCFLSMAHLILLFLAYPALTILLQAWLIIVFPSTMETGPYISGEVFLFPWRLICYNCSVEQPMHCSCEYQDIHRLFRVLKI